jgi:hypothetical protein
MLIAHFNEILDYSEYCSVTALHTVIDIRRDMILGVCTVGAPISIFLTFSILDEVHRGLRDHTRSGRLSAFRPQVSRICRARKIEFQINVASSSM